MSDLSSESGQERNGEEEEQTGGRESRMEDGRRALTEYNAFVRANPESIKKLEDASRLVTMFIPTARFGRFSEVFQESTYSVLGLMSLYHNRVLHGASALALDSSAAPARQIRLFLTLCGHTEVVVEMLARVLRGEDARWRVITLIEWVKAVLRLILLSQTGTKSLLASGGRIEQVPAPAQADGEDGEGGEDGQALGPAQVEDVTEAAAEGKTPGEVEVGVAAAAAAADAEAAEPSADKPPAKWAGKRTGKTLALPKSLEAFDNVNVAVTTSSGSGGSSGSAHRPASAAGGDAVDVVDGPEDVYLRMAGECLHILRPCIYVTQLGSRRTKRWSPFLVSLAIELVSARCSSVAGTSAAAAAAEAAANPSASEAAGEDAMTRAAKKFLYGGGAQGKASQDELKRRRMLLGLYMMRSPLFDRITLPAVERFAAGLGRMPFGASIEPMVVETVMYYHRNHFYTSAS